MTTPTQPGKPQAGAAAPASAVDSKHEGQAGPPVPPGASAPALDWESAAANRWPRSFCRPPASSLKARASGPGHSPKELSSTGSAPSAIQAMHPNRRGL